MDDTNLSIVKVDNIKKFWLSFTTWFEDELPGTGILKAYYEDYDNWNGGIYYLGISDQTFPLQADQRDAGQA